MDRRNFIRALLGTPLLLGSGVGQAMAAPSGKTLVVVFLRGGCDGLNMVVPYGDDAYYQNRPTLGIPAPGSGKPNAALDLDGFFGLHPLMAPVNQLYAEGRMAILPAVHYSGATFSHFDEQDTVECGSLTSITSGWLARYLNLDAATAGGRALSLTDNVPLSLVGTSPVPSYANISGLKVAKTTANQTAMTDFIGKTYAATPNTASPYGGLLHATGLNMLADIDRLSSVAAMVPENGAVYPATNLGTGMKQAASLIKSGMGLEVLTLDNGSWDTHSSQGAGETDGAQSKLIDPLAKAIEAFFTDLGAASSSVMVLVQTEFGRTVAENGSGGTDHGYASAWLAFGDSVQGGIHLGTRGWPGLAAEQLYKGRYLDFTVDFRDVYAEVLTGFMGVSSLSTLLPGYTPTSVGFVG
jgi:uncharacterized protein (DUF1501 family)